MRKITLMIAITVIATVVGGAICFGEPDSVTGYLINEPISLMDWGLHNLANRIQEQVLNDGKNKNLANSLDQFFFVEVYFDIKKNKIIIKVPSLAKMKPKGSKEYVALTIEEAKQWSKRIIFAIKNNLGVDPKTGQPQWGDDSTFIYSDYFSHQGWAKKGEPLNIKKSLDQLIVIQTECLINKGDEKLICFSPLTDEQIFYSEPLPYKK